MISPFPSFFSFIILVFGLLFKVSVSYIYPLAPSRLLATFFFLESSCLFAPLTFFSVIYACPLLSIVQKWSLAKPYTKTPPHVHESTDYRFLLLDFGFGIATSHSPTTFLSCAAGIAPVKCPSGLPNLNAITVGRARISYFLASSTSLSVSTVTKSTSRPSV